MPESNPNQLSDKHIESNISNRWKWFFALSVVLTIGIQWAIGSITPGQLMMDVPRWSSWAFLETQWTYFYLHIFTFIPVFCLSFDKNVHYYRKWRHLLPAVLVVALVFIIWDVVFTISGVWGFNESYLSGLFFLGLPMEEWLFFFTVPFACVFIYECLNFYIKKDLLKDIEPYLTKLLIVLFLGIGIWKFNHAYTATTFLGSGLFLLYHQLFERASYRSRFYLAYLVTWLPFMLVNGVLTGGFTQEPVVIYNPEEYFGFRIGSVPIDDSVYSFLMLLGVTTLFERWRPDKN